MNTYLTPEPITCEIRNASGSVTIDLTDTPTTSVELIPSGRDGGGGDGAGNFLDDVFRSEMFRSLWGPSGRGAGGTAGATLDATEDVVVEFEDNKLIVDTEPARRQWHTGFTVRITAPRGSNIRTRTETASVALRGTPDRVEVKTASGQVDIATTGPHTFLRNVSGNIEVHDAGAGKLDLAAVSGSLVVGLQSGVGAKVDLVTVAGKARSTLTVQDHLDAPALTITGRTVSGNIDLHSAAS